MIRVHLETVVLGAVPGTSLIILRPVGVDTDHDLILPICIGTVEAAAISRALAPQRSARPMTHALLASMLAQLDAKLDRVIIDKVKGTIFYATLVVKRTFDEIKIDARPSDAVALAIRLHAPIYVEEEVLLSAGFPAWVNIPKEQQAVMEEAFHSFVEDLSPEDFSC